MPKKKTLEVAKKEISEKYSYLELLEFNGNEKVALFLDNKYGQFEGNYRSVLRNRKSHPARANLDKRQKTIKTNLQKYGTAAPSQNKDIYNKIIQTNLKKYGCENPLQNKIIKEKIKKTNLERYGYEWVVETEIFKQKRNLTMLNKYNTIHAQQNKNIINKTKQTCLEKYGVKNISQSTLIKNKKIQKCKNAFGCDHIFQSEKIKNKIKKTNLEKYGFENAAKNKIIKSKIIQSNLKNKLYHNINGQTLSEYHKNSTLPVAYSTLQQNYNTYGDIALKKSHYNNLQNSSKIANLWLESIEKKLGYKLVREYHIKTTRYHADGYDPKTNMVYEFNGDIWHGNLNKLNAADKNPINGRSYQELYNNTIKKENIIKSLGFGFTNIWEDEFNALNKMP